MCSVPLKEESRKKFIAAIPVNLQLSVQKYSRICSKHFTTDAFQATTSTSVRRILKRDAVPTLFDHQYHCTPVNEVSKYLYNVYCLNCSISMENSTKACFGETCIYKVVNETILRRRETIINIYYFTGSNAWAFDFKQCGI